jgi:outer membrane protein assembly factor BamD (BamD/ComL family)
MRRPDVNRKGLAVLGMALVMLLAACHKKTVVPPLPTPPRLDEIQVAEKQFEGGDYAAAAASYAQILQRNPTPEKREMALFRLALAYALPGTGIQQWTQAISYFRQLLAAAPKSAVRTQVQVILALYDELELTRTQDRAKDLQIKNLSSELDKLKKIDLQKRPSRPE